MDTFQETIFKLKRYWSDRGAIIQEPYDVEVGAGTMCPETFLRVLGPSRIGWRMCSQVVVLPMAGTARIQIVFTSTSSCR